MKDVTQQLADALRPFADSLVAQENVDHPSQDWREETADTVVSISTSHQRRGMPDLSPDHTLWVGAFRQAREALAAFEACAAPDDVAPSEPGEFVGDIFFGDPDNSTRGTHRWDGSQWVELPDERASMVELLTSARAQRDELLQIARRWSALDGGAWHVQRHASEKAELLADTRAAIAKSESA